MKGIISFIRSLFQLDTGDMKSEMEEINQKREECQRRLMKSNSSHRSLSQRKRKLIEEAENLKLKAHATVGNLQTQKI